MARQEGVAVLLWLCLLSSSAGLEKPVGKSCTTPVPMHSVVLTSGATDKTNCNQQTLPLPVLKASKSQIQGAAPGDYWTAVLLCHKMSEGVGRETCDKTFLSLESRALGPNHLCCLGDQVFTQ